MSCDEISERWHLDRAKAKAVAHVSRTIEEGSTTLTSPIVSCCKDLAKATPTATIKNSFLHFSDGSELANKTVRRSQTSTIA